MNKKCKPFEITCTSPDGYGVIKDYNPKKKSIVLVDKQTGERIKLK